MLNIDLTKTRSAEPRRGEVIEWRSGDTARGGEDRTDTSNESPAEQRMFALAVAP